MSKENEYDRSRSSDSLFFILSTIYAYAMETRKTANVLLLATNNILAILIIILSIQADAIILVFLEHNSSTTKRWGNFIG
jgi:hypothetical protein